MQLKGAALPARPFNSRLCLERHSFVEGAIATIRFLPRAWRAISARRVAPVYTFHIFDRNEIPVGISRPELLYPASDSDIAALKDPIIRLEDRRFLEHRGIDARAICRAAYANLKAGRFVQGASTITQQVVRNSLLTPHRSLLRKGLEALLAWKLERHYSKEEILRLYVEFVYLGNGAKGFPSAARSYFRRPLSRLSDMEFNGLLGLLRSPARYSPLRNDGNDFIGRSQFIQRALGISGNADAPARPITLNPIKANQISKPRLASLVEDELRRNGEVARPSRVATSIDSALQRKLDRILQSASRSKSIKTCAAIIVSNRDMRVIAEAGWIDGRELDFSPSYFGAIQPASTFKTFALLSAMEQGITLDFPLESRPYVSKKFETKPGRPWEVRNYAHIYRGVVPLLEAFKASDNTAFARLLEVLDLERVYDTYSRFGLCERRRASPSVILGGITRGISLKALVEAYACIARHGIYSTVSVATKGAFFDSERVFTPKICEPSLRIELDVCERLRFALYESGRWLNGGRISGKTGTTSKGNTFVGYTDEVSAAIWVGFRRAIPEYQRKTGAAVRLLDGITDYLFGMTGASLKIV